MFALCATAGDLTLLGVVAEDHAFADVYTFGCPRGAKGEVQDVCLGIVAPLKRAGLLQDFHRFHMILLLNEGLPAR